MQLAIERFDKSEAIRIRNTARRTPVGAALPIDFPFIVDEDSGAIVEPVLLFMAAKFWSAGAMPVKNGRWRYRNSADAAASDLKDWWDHLDERGLVWNELHDRDLGHYLKNLRDSISEQTGDFLADATYARRCASIEGFHNWAAVRWPDRTFPSLLRAALGAGVGKKGPRSHRDEHDPRPIPPEDVNRIAARLGPLPSERGRGQSSRSRLAFELGVNVGCRVDEVCGLRADAFASMGEAGADEDAVELRLTRTKGLVPRTVFIPMWLVREIKHYVANEREECVAAARRSWLGEDPQPPNLLLNRPDAPADRGKATTPDTIDKNFNAACVDLKLVKNRVIAENTEHEGEIEVPRHRFHDCRHTFAYWTYLALVRQEVDPGMRREPWLYIQSRLGHADVETTVGTYLRVFNDLNTPTLAALGRYFLQVRRTLAAAEDVA